MSPLAAPLFVTRDRSLLDELLRLAAAAGVTPEVAADAAAALRGWIRAPLVLIGADVAEELAQVAPPRRARAHLVAWGPVPDEMFRTALRVGAEDIATLPQSESWLVESMTDLNEVAPAVLTLGVIGGSGGAGATTFACALGQMAGRSGPSVVIDTDPVGPGVDRVLGLDGDSGVRWDALQQTTGRLSARTLREALPRRAGVGALSWAPGPQASVQAFALREALSAAQRGHETVVVDLPRQHGPLADELVARCDRVVVLVLPTIPGVASAVRLCHRLRSSGSLWLVVRGHGVSATEIAALTKAPVIATMPNQKGLAESIDLGAGPLRGARGPLARAARTVLHAAREAS
jgi:secretion/DNA translocation related CpaE-like protein